MLRSTDLSQAAAGAWMRVKRAEALLRTAQHSAAMVWQWLLGSGASLLHRRALPTLLATAPP